MQSQRTLPADVLTRNARCPMPNFGSVEKDVSPGSSSCTLAVYSLRSSSRVVHRWPSRPTYCRSSVQMRHSSGYVEVSPNWVPQVTQIAFIRIPASFFRDVRQRHVDVPDRLTIPGISHVQVAFSSFNECRIGVLAGLRFERLEHPEMFSVFADRQIQRSATL